MTIKVLVVCAGNICRSPAAEAAIEEAAWASFAEAIENGEGIDAAMMAAEDIVLNYVKGSHPTPQGMAGAREECGAVIAKLGKRLRGES